MSNDAMQVQDVAKAWIQMHYLPEASEERQRLFWAYERLCGLIDEEPESAWRIIEEIRRLDGSDRILSNLAAGPLEDLLVAHGNQFIDRIEDAADKDQQLRKLLGAVWQNAMPDGLWRRLAAIAAPSW